MNEYTTFYVYNENGLLKQEQVENLVSQLVLNETGNVVTLSKQDIDIKSTVHKKIVFETVELTIYDHGYVFKVEGSIPEALSIVLRLDELIAEKVDLYVSPSQRIVNSPDLLLKRGGGLTELSIFFDKIFKVDDYTRAVNRLK